MMMATEIEITINVKKALETLRHNRARHGEIVAEARQGFLKDAREALAEKLAQLETGKLVELTFSISPPRDYTKVYNVAIQTLELHTEETLQISGEQVRTLMMDDWDWTQGFLTSTSHYSSLARKAAKMRGLVE